MKVLLAFGENRPEEYIKENLKPGYEIVGSVLYREAVIAKVKELAPDVLVLREALKGAVSIDNILYKLRTECSFCRIVFVAGKHNVGDDFLKNLVNRGIYDVEFGSQVSMGKILDMIYTPSTYADAVKLQGEDTLDLSNESTEATPITVVIEEPEIPIQKSRKLKKADDKNIIQSTYVIEDDYIEGTYSGAYTSVSNTVNNSYEVIPQNYSENYSYPVTYYASQQDINNYSNLNVYNNYVPEYVKKISSSKVLTFAAVRQGVGCTSTLLNVAALLCQMGKKVLVVDAVFDYPYISSVLEIPQYGFMDNVFNDHKYGNYGTVKQYCRTYSLFSNNGIDIISFSQEYHIRETVDTANMIEGVLNDLSRYYDNILIDVNLSLMDPFTTSFLIASDNIITVTTQDRNLLKMLDDAIRSYEQVCVFKKKMLLVINKYHSAGLDINAIKSYFNVVNACCIGLYTEGYLQADLSNSIYFIDKKCSKKFKKDMKQLVSYIC